MTKAGKNRARLAIWILSIGIVATLPCFGQAWVPAKGEGEVVLVYQNLYTRDHLYYDGSVHDNGHIRIVGLLETVDFGLTDKLALTASFPEFKGKYNGALPHPFLDD